MHLYIPTYRQQCRELRAHAPSRVAAAEGLCGPEPSIHDGGAHLPPQKGDGGDGVSNDGFAPPTVVTNAFEGRCKPRSLSPAG